MNEVQDYNDHPGLDEEIDDWYPDSSILFRPNGTISKHVNAITFTSGSSTSITNFPSGTSITYTTKQQLND